VEAALAARDLVDREAQCCRFLDFELATESDRVSLDITSVSSPGQRIAAFLAGLDPDPSSACC
jgi:hypothetical protein